MDISDVATGVATADVTVTTTSETVAVSSDPAVLGRETGRVLILAWCQLTTGAAATTVTPRIRRGTTVSGALVGEANAVTVVAANTVNVFVVTQEDRAGERDMQYALTVQQAAATGNGTVLQAGILVIVLS